ncbi:hypothetical protein phytr_4490 [Candidatus Phycorickettsia trachydisci]|uniref:Uncharacterized protein n=1 Tax=Candidatus Phycorickettsia trachydisci TaxID=2115978 RepID=A0A2P1P802_9RICK|nr:hypothetical protein [Candidatus Phycorickettsia trachydisci]AVP87399.1 hypothetical protein phytr_4490 [Candidatus Phycorickettsia trachydisci]
MDNIDNTDVGTTTTKFWNNKLKDALMEYDPKGAEEALERGANPNDGTLVRPFCRSFLDAAIMRLNKDIIKLAADQLQIKEQIVEEKAKQIITILLDYGADISILHPYTLMSQAVILKECADYLAPEKEWEVLKQLSRKLFENRNQINLEIKNKIIEKFVDKLKDPQAISLEDMQLIQIIYLNFSEDSKVSTLYSDLTNLKFLTKITLPTISAIVNKDEPLSEPHKIMQKLATHRELISQVLSYFDPEDTGSVLATIHPGERLTNLDEQLKKVRPEDKKKLIQTLLEPIIRSMTNAVKQEVQSKLDANTITPADLKALEIAKEFDYFDPELTQLNCKLSGLHLKTDIVTSDELEG